MGRYDFKFRYGFPTLLLITLLGTLLGGVLVWAMTGRPPESSLVSYFVKWHATARGSMKSGWGPNPDGAFQDVRDTHKAEMSGSAIVRLRDPKVGEYLLTHDTRYLVVNVHEDWERWSLQHSSSPDRDCIGHVSEVISDNGKYSGTYVPNGKVPLSLMREGRKQADGSVVFQQPFTGLNDMNFTERFSSVLLGACQGTVSREREVHSYLSGTVARREVGFKSTKDQSSFTLNAHFTYGSSPTGSDEVQWTAEASRMGKCAEHDAPIPDGDPVVQDEDVNISSDDSEIQPDGSTKVHITVTCDQVPIKDAEIELTIEPQDKSGGHMHTDKRPRGKLKDTELTDKNPSITVKTDANGKATVKFEPPGKTDKSKNVGIAGVYEVKGTSKRFPDRTAAVPIAVGFTNLTSLAESPDAYYEVVRGHTDTHPGGTFGTVGTLSAFQNLARDFYQTQEHHNDQLQKCNKTPWRTRKASFNDIALTTGGLFDWKSSWAPPHQTHGRGQGGDLNHFHESGKLVECNGSKVNFDDWLKATLLELGNKYGHWDQWDLDQKENFLHLHVED